MSPFDNDWSISSGPLLYDGGGAPERSTQNGEHLRTMACYIHSLFSYIHS